MEGAMKDTAIAHSIGAALQACAERVHADQIHAGQVAEQVYAERQKVRPAAPAAIARNQPAPQPVHLTQRQLDVLALLCEGLPNKRICRRLNIATGTVKVHISCILRELGVTSRLQAVVAASRWDRSSDFAQRAAS
jgi:DNA-binding NarL/FixJ family response regulator